MAASGSRPCLASRPAGGLHAGLRAALALERPGCQLRTHGHCASGDARKHSLRIERVRRRGRHHIQARRGDGRVSRVGRVGRRRRLASQVEAEAGACVGLGVRGRRRARWRRWAGRWRQRQLRLAST
eukprot:scaffold32774_cov65-Phaeocystis_antarctica.AAC.3